MLYYVVRTGLSGLGLNADFEHPTKEAVNEWLQNQATLLLHQVVARQDSKEVVAVASPAKDHSAWVQSMAKYRRLAPMDDKDAMLDSLDERFRCRY